VTGRGAPPGGGPAGRDAGGRIAGPALLVATFNPGKAREIARLLSGAGIATAGLRDRGIAEPFDERGETYEENALGKARHYAALAGMIAVADDSGIEVDALGGAPGPVSARYGGPDLDDPGRCRLLLETLDGVPEEERGARYVAAVAVARPDGAARAFRGVCAGRIAPGPRGTGGFGYDPVFVHPPSGATFAQIPEEEKNRLSHRGRALARLAEFLGSPEGRAFLEGSR
jgi:XTP/dITP diphosphohydrolase